MEAVEFIRTIQKMCEGTDCDVCPLNEKNGCNVCYAEDPVGSVRIVEEWAAEQERKKAEQERQNPEQERKKAELHDKTYALREKVDHTPTKEESQTPEQKRTNKDELLAAFPNARMDDNGIPCVCPDRLNEHYNCYNIGDCLVCRCEYWFSEVEE